MKFFSPTVIGAGQRESTRVALEGRNCEADGWSWMERPPAHGMLQWHHPTHSGRSDFPQFSAQRQCLGRFPHADCQSQSPHHRYRYHSGKWMMMTPLRLELIELTSSVTQVHWFTIFELLSDSTGSLVELIQVSKLMGLIVEFI